MWGASIMPNWITNVMSLHGPEIEIKKLIDFVQSEDQLFDFNKIVPMPKSLNIEKTFPIKTEDSQIRMENFVNYGHEDWYSWRSENWGTKWNCRQVDDNNPMEWDSKKGVYQICFDTAWNTPLPIFNKIQQLFPLVKIYVMWRDECWNENKYYMGFGFKEDDQGIIDWDDDFAIK
jgi:hypothetical protein